MQALSGLSGISGLGPRNLYRCTEEFSTTDSNGPIWAYGVRDTPEGALIPFPLFTAPWWSKDPFPGDYALIGSTAMHPPTPPQEACIDFKCPRDGVYQLFANFIGADVSVDGINFFFRRNGVELSSVFIQSTASPLNATTFCRRGDILTLAMNGIGNNRFDVVDNRSYEIRII